MKIFDLFKRNNKPKNRTTDNGVLGPTFLDGFTAHIDNPKNLHSQEWRRKVRSTSGHTKFKIKFYGQRHSRYKNLIVGTDFAPALITAADTTTAQEIILFDGCKHGYTALFCDNYTEEQINNRHASNYFADKNGNEIFEIIISTLNNFDFENEMREEVDENGLIELMDGTKVEFDQVKRNGYDVLQILVIDNNGKVIEIVSEELS